MSRAHNESVIRRGVVLLAGLLAMATTAAPAFAQSDVITGCGQICQIGGCGGLPNCRTASSGKCKLTADITCTSSDSSIELEDGTDLDLQGNEITCTSGSCAYYAITMYDTSSKVTSSTTGSGADVPAVIAGPFNGAVDCDNFAGSIVENVTVQGGIIGVLSCQTVRHNVLDGVGTGVWGVVTTGISSSDSITDNFFSGWYYPIATATTQNVDILRNVVNTAGSVTAFILGSGVASASGNAKFNVFHGDGTALFATAATDTTSYDGNFCDPNAANCSTCISSGRCLPYTSPFTGN